MSARIAGLVASLLLVAACGDDAEVSAPSSTTEETSTSRPTMTTSSPTSTTTGAAHLYTVSTHGAGAVAPLPGSETRLGSGCTPGPGALPDGIWFGFVTAKGDGAFDFDLACLDAGSPASASNTNTTVRQVPSDNRLTIHGPNGIVGAFADWSPDNEAAWVYVNDGAATEVASPNLDWVWKQSPNWVEAEVTLPVGGGCCGTDYSGPASSSLPWPGSGPPNDGIYFVSAQIDLADDEIVLQIRPFVACVDHPDLCLPNFADTDVTVDRGLPFEWSFPLGTDLAVRIRGIAPPQGAAPLGARGIEGSGDDLGQLIGAMQTAWELWIEPRLGSEPAAFELEAELLARGADDPSFPYGPSFGYGPGHGPLAYRGPLGLQISNFLGPEPTLVPWATQLEIRIGRPILIIDAGQIAG